MLNCRRSLGKGSKVRFTDPPWDAEHPKWRELDLELEEDHIARQVVAAMEMLDLTPLFESYSGRGSPAIRPDLMLRIALIEMRLGRNRPSNWHLDSRENAPLKWAGMGIRPCRTVWYDFYDRVAPFLENWVQKILELALLRDVSPGERASLDGSTFAANASRHRLVNEQTLAKRMEQLREAVANDGEEKPVEDVPAWMAKTPRTRAAQLKRYRQADSRLAELHVINDRQHRNRRRERGKVVVSLSDPESALGLDKLRVFRPLYNVQLLRDLDSPLIFHYSVLAQATDAGTLKPTVAATCSVKGLDLKELFVDSSYVTGINLAYCHQMGIALYGPWQENDYSKKAESKKMAEKKLGKKEFSWQAELGFYRCPQGHPLKWIGQQNRRQADGEIHVMHSYRCNPEHCLACSLAPCCTTNPSRGRSVIRSEHEELIEAHRERMQTPEAKELYAKRKQTVELAFADVKEHRALRRFPRRGLDRAQTHAGLAVLVHNLLVVYRALRTAEPVEGAEIPDT